MGRTLVLNQEWYLRSEPGLSITGFTLPPNKRTELLLFLLFLSYITLYLFCWVLFKDSKHFCTDILSYTKAFKTYSPPLILCYCYLLVKGMGFVWYGKPSTKIYSHFQTEALGVLFKSRCTFNYFQIERALYCEQWARTSSVKKAIDPARWR